MSFLNSLFSGKPKEPEYPVVTDFTAVATDIHSHLIPGIDDGVKTIDESVDMIRKFSSLGYKRLVTTPHVMSDYFKNTPDIINEGLQTVRQAVSKAGINIVIDAAAEYYLDEEFVRKLGSEKLMCIDDSLLLFEISYINPPEYVNNVLFELAVKNYRPLLAHPERYDYWYNRPEEYKKLKDAGALFQLNMNSITGYYGVAAKRTAGYLIDNNMVDYIGSDLHGQRHMDGMLRLLNERHFHKLMSMGVGNSAL